MSDVSYQAESSAMYYNQGLAHVARDLDRRIRDINPEAWLIMHREMLEFEGLLGRKPVEEPES